MLLKSKKAITQTETILIILVLIVGAVAGYYVLATPPVPPEPLPGELKVSNLVISPAQVIEGGAVTISADVENIGEASATGDVALRLNGAVEKTETVTVEGGDTQTVTFTVTKSPEDYEVDVAGLTGTFIVSMAVRNPNTFISASIGEPDSVDPAWLYDSASKEIIYNVYEPLIAFDGGSTSTFVPMLATEVPSVANGLISPDGLTYTFNIRTGVKFHNGETLTPADVEYTFERALVQDRSGGPIWMFYEPLLDIHGSRSGGAIRAELLNGTLIDNTITSDETSVTFHLAKSYPPFLSILAQGCGPYIVNQKFCVEHNDWPGTWNNWTEYNNPNLSPLDDPVNVMCGTGPYEFTRWEHGVEWQIDRFDDYWREPASIKTAIYKKIDEWSTRKLLYIAGDIDKVYVPRQYMLELEDVSGLLRLKDLPALSVTSAFFNQKISPTSPYLGSGEFDANDDGSPDGIPPTFFSDINVRYGFATAFDWETYLTEAWFNEAKQIPGPVIDGIPYSNMDQEMFHYNLTKSEEYFKLAWGGELWEKGFELTILYNTGNDQRKTASFMFKDAVESLNEKFKIYVRAVEWPVYVDELVDNDLTLFALGWGADYPDPHNFAHPFMHSLGDLSGFTGYNNTHVDYLLNAGMETTDPAERQAIYWELAELYYEDCPGLSLAQATARRWFRDWIQGYVYNPIHPQFPYVYSLTKGYD